MGIWPRPGDLKFEGIKSIKINISLTARIILVDNKFDLRRSKGQIGQI